MPTHTEKSIQQMALAQVRTKRLLFYFWRMICLGKNVLVFLLTNVVIGGIILTLLEEELSFADGQYLAFITALTVGYGDLSPDSGLGRIVSCLIGVNGLILTGVVIALAVKGLELTFREEMEKLEHDPAPKA